MDPIVLLMSMGRPVDDVNIDRLIGYVDIFCYFNYYNVVLFKYLRIILHVYMFFFICISRAACDYEIQDKVNTFGQCLFQ